MAIRFDDTNLHAHMVGDAHGLTPSEIDAGTPEALSALAGFRAVWESGKVGFPDLPKQTVAKDILAYVETVKGSYDTVCLVGIGGSALGAWAVDCGVRGPHPVQSAANPRLVILDNVDPEFIQLALASMKPKKTIVVVIAKSGATAETVATFLIVKEWLEAGTSAKAAAKKIVVVTSEGRGDLKVLATQQGYTTFHVPENVGGRFSVLSAVGLVPTALMGVDILKLLKGAAKMTASCWSSDLSENLALRAALYHWLILTEKKKVMQVSFPYANRLWGTAFWFRQLWAESLGKAKNRQGETIHTGQTPIAALGTTDQHSQVQLYIEGPNDKVFTFWAVAKPSDKGAIPASKPGLEGFDYLAGQSLAKLIDAERRSTEAALTENNRPNCCFTLDKIDEEHIGAFFQLMEFETAFLGELLDIDAFDQEGVELGKKFTFALMGRKGFAEFKDRFNAYQARRKG